MCPHAWLQAQKLCLQKLLAIVVACMDLLSFSLASHSSILGMERVGLYGGGRDLTFGF